MTDGRGARAHSAVGVGGWGGVQVRYAVSFTETMHKSYFCQVSDMYRKKMGFLK